MPWKECNQMDERLKFIARLLDGDKMAVLCREFNISRKTGYKTLKRYNDCRLQWLTIAPGGLIVRPISCRCRSRSRLCA